jgi:putative ABC transport system permease protein
MAFLNALPGAVAEGLIWGLMAIGIYISFKILDIADMTVDGSICTGGCVCAVLLGLGVPVWLAVFAAFIAGALAGMLTGILHTALGIPSILAGILTQLMLYTVNLCILGGRSLITVDHRANTLLLHMSNNNMAIVTGVLFVAGLIVALWLFFYTEVGLTLKSTGDNPDMSRAQGVNVDFIAILEQFVKHVSFITSGRSFQIALLGEDQ